MTVVGSKGLWWFGGSRLLDLARYTGRGREEFFDALCGASMNERMLAEVVRRRRLGDAVRSGGVLNEARTLSGG